MIKNKKIFKAYISKPENCILVVMSIVLVLFTMVPLLSLFRDSIVIHPSELLTIRGSKIGDFTGFHWKKVFADGEMSFNIFYKPLLNSLTISIGSCLIALITGGYVAWLIARTNLKHKQIISTLFILPYIMPSWTIALAWRNLFRNSYAGGSIGIFSTLTGLEVPNWFAYGPFPIIITMGIHYAPFAYILIGGVLKNMDANLEEAAEIMNASRFTILLKITFPITLPAILSTILLVFSSTFGSYAVPVFLGSAVKYQVLTTQLNRCLAGTSVGYGYVMAIVMIGFGVTILGLNQALIGYRKSYTTITGKSSNIAFTKLKHRQVLSTLLVVIVGIITIFPLFSFIFESITTHPGNYNINNLTTQYWTGTAQLNVANSEPGILKNTLVWSAMKNSIILSLIVSFIAGTSGILIGYATVKKKRSKLSHFLSNLAFFPYLMPSLAFGAIYLSLFSKKIGPFPSLYGTLGLLVIAGSVKYLPFAAKAGANGMMQMGDSIEEAAELMNIPWWKRMTQIIFPIQKASFMSCFLLPFISSMRELSLYIMLCTPNNRVVTTLLFAYNERGIEQYANAINLLIVIIVVAFNLLVNRVTGASIDKGIGG